MPLHAILHVRYAVSLRGSRDDTARAGSVAESFVGTGETFEIISILGHCDRKTEGFPLIGNRFEVQNILGVANSLQTVQVDYDGERTKLLVGGKKRGLPRRTFIA